MLKEKHFLLVVNWLRQKIFGGFAGKYHGLNFGHARLNKARE